MERLGDEGVDLIEVAGVVVELYLVDGRKRMRRGEERRGKIREVQDNDA